MTNKRKGRPAAGNSRTATRRDTYLESNNTVSLPERQAAEKLAERIRQKSVRPNTNGDFPEIEDVEYGKCFVMFHMQRFLVILPELNNVAPKVFDALVRHINTTDRPEHAWPSINTLCRESGLSKPSVISGLDSLEKMYVIKRVSRGSNLTGKSTVYHINPFYVEVRKQNPK